MLGALVGSSFFMEYLVALLDRNKDLHFSDIHLAVGVPPAVRVDGKMKSLKESTPPTAEDIDTIVRVAMTERQYRDLQAGGEIDTVFIPVPGMRLRLNAYQERHGVALALRAIRSLPPDAEDLGLPDSLKSAALRPSGLILIVGPAGSGKSTTAAALVEHINAHEERHIITLEESIEYLHENNRSFINQRSVGTGEHSVSFAHALIAALREDPDVISIGDMRDHATMALALSAAETGHLVIAQMHAGTTYQAISRIVSSFSNDEHRHVREQLAQRLIIATAQRLLPMTTGGRTLAMEVLVNTHAIRVQIRENNLQGISDSIRTGRESGMFLLEDHMDELLRRGIIEGETVRRYLGHEEGVTH